MRIFLREPYQALGLCWHPVGQIESLPHQNAEPGEWDCKLETGAEGVCMVGQEKRVSCLPRESHSSFVGRREPQTEEAESTKLCPPREPCLSELKCGRPLRFCW